MPAIMATIGCNSNKLKVTVIVLAPRLLSSEFRSHRQPANRRHAYIIAVGELRLSHVFPTAHTIANGRQRYRPFVVSDGSEAYRMPMLMPGKLMPMPGPYTTGG